MKIPPYYPTVLTVVLAALLFTSGHVTADDSAKKEGEVPAAGPEQRSALRENFVITQELHSRLESYTNELIKLINAYLYREEKLVLDDLIAQILPVFKGYVSEAKYNIWTINRLLYLEHFHEEWEQKNPKAFTVIMDFIESTEATLSESMTELETVPRKVPSMVDVPLLMDHYTETKDMLIATRLILKDLYDDIRSYQEPLETASAP